MRSAFSSGALSISSTERAWPPYVSESTLVIAAVRVVLPWSMCPMVPMLTCGLVRSNLALATGFLSSWSRVVRELWGGLAWGPDGVLPPPGRSLAGRLRDDLLGDVGRDLGVRV